MDHKKHHDEFFECIASIKEALGSCKNSAIHHCYVQRSLCDHCMKIYNDHGSLCAQKPNCKKTCTKSCKAFFKKFDEKSD